MKKAVSDKGGGFLSFWEHWRRAVCSRTTDAVQAFYSPASKVFPACGLIRGKLEEDGRQLLWYLGNPGDS